MKQIYKIILLSAIFSLTACGDEESQDVTGGSSSSSSSSGGTLTESSQTGIFVSDDFFMAFDDGTPEIYSDTGSYTTTDVVITIRAKDSNNLVQTGINSPVNFRVNWGSFDTDQCDLSSDGTCNVTWHSGNPDTGPSCFVAFTAYASGEESFVDANDDGLFNQGESFTDLEEPFLDVNANGSFDSTGLELIDVAEYSDGKKNGSHDAADGEYNGSLCASASDTDCSSTNSTIIWDKGFIRIRTGTFVDTDDIDNDADTTEVFTCIL